MALPFLFQTPLGAGVKKDDVSVDLRGGRGTIRENRYSRLGIFDELRFNVPTETQRMKYDRPTPESHTSK